MRAISEVILLLILNRDWRALRNRGLSWFDFQI